MKIIFFANTDWYLFNFRLDLARYLQNRGAEVVMMSPPGDYGIRFENEGFRWISLPMKRRSLNLINEMRLVKIISNIYKQEAPDLVHNFTIKSVVYGGLAAQMAGIKTRIHAITGLGHVFINHSARAQILRLAVKCLLRLALRGKNSSLILQNPDDRQLFYNLKLIASDHIHMIKGSGVDTNRFIPVKRKTGPSFKVLLASRLLWEKGIKEYIKAAALLTHRTGEIEFLLAGASDPGNPSSIPEATIRKWQVSGLVKILGHVDDIHRLMSKIDLMVLPSHREGVPRGLIEAASMELPIITTDVPGCREIVEDGVNGILVPVGDSAALARGIEFLLNTPQVCTQFGMAGRKKVVSEFDQDIVFQQTWNVYCSLGLGG
jgi:glycosyltransferase involved in cell wall biosynthesis